MGFRLMVKPCPRHNPITPHRPDTVRGGLYVSSTRAFQRCIFCLTQIWFSLFYKKCGSVNPPYKGLPTRINHCQEHQGSMGSYLRGMLVRVLPLRPRLAFTSRTSLSKPTTRRSGSISIDPCPLTEGSCGQPRWRGKPVQEGRRISRWDLGSSRWIGKRSRRGSCVRCRGRCWINIDSRCSSVATLPRLLLPRRTEVGG